MNKDDTQQKLDTAQLEYQQECVNALKNYLVKIHEVMSATEVEPTRLDLFK